MSNPENPTCANFFVKLGCDGYCRQICPQLLPHGTWSGQPFDSDWLPVDTATCGLTGQTLESGLNYTASRVPDPYHAPAHRHS